MKNCITLILLFISLFSFSQCENDSINPYFVNFEHEVTISCDVDLSVAFPVAFDNCDDSVEIAWYEEITAGFCDNTYDLFRVYRAFDDNGNSKTEIQTIHVVDETPPLISPISDYTIECNDSINFDTPQITDNCNEFSVNFYDITETEDSCTTNYIRVWMATDFCGNTSQTSQTITLQDLTPPNITGEIYLEFPEGTNLDSIFVTVSDNCSTTTISYTDVDVSGNNVIRTYTATDYCGNTSTFEQIIHIDIVIPPGDDDDDDDDEDDDDEDDEDDGEDDEDGEDEDDDDDEDNDRVAICHRTGNGSYHTIYVAPQAVPAHLAHGDYLGPCTEIILDWQTVLPNSDLEMTIIKGYDNKYRKFVKVK